MRFLKGLLTLCLITAHGGHLRAAVPVEVKNNSKHPIAVIVLAGQHGKLPSTETKTFPVPRFFDDSLRKNIELAIIDYVATKKLPQGWKADVAVEAAKQMRGCYRTEEGVLTKLKWSTEFCKTIKAMDVRLIPAGKSVKMNFWQNGLFSNKVEAYQFREKWLGALGFRVFYNARDFLTTKRPVSIEYSDEDFKVSEGESFGCRYISGYSDVEKCLKGRI